MRVEIKNINSRGICALHTMGCIHKLLKNAQIQYYFSYLILCYFSINARPSSFNLLQYIL